jgi:amylosucrase
MQEYVRVDETALEHVLDALSRERSIGLRPDPAFDRRLEQHFPDLYRLFRSLYESRQDWLDQLIALVVESARSWQERPADLKALDAQR